MDRRTFVLLTGAASGAMLIPEAHGDALRVKGHRPIGRLRFTLDDDRRWSLWYQGGEAPVPIVEDAELGVWVGDRFVALGDLEDTAIGTRRPPTGESLVVRGRGADVYVEAEFVTSESRATPLASITVSLYPDRTLPACHGVRFFQLPEPGILPDAAPLLALVSGYDSSAGCRIADAGDVAADLTSHGALGLTRGGRGLGLTFDPGEPGEAKVRLRTGTLEAVSDWLPARPLRPQGDSSTLRLSYDPDADALTALAALFQPASAVDLERLATFVGPAGWRSGGGLAPATEAAVLANLDFCATHFGPHSFSHIQVDDGYQQAAGSWDTNAGFPSGHRSLTERIQARGFRAGLWMAPFAVAESSGVPAQHPGWLVRNGDGPVVFAERADWGGRVYGLDGAHPEVQQWLYALGQRVVREWRYDCLHADCVAWTAPDVARYGGLTHAEAFRRGLTALREGLGPDAFLVTAGSPLQHAVGLVNAMRIGPDVTPSWGAIRDAARAAGLRSFYQRGAWINDPDAVVVGLPLGESEARAWASVVAVSGGTALCTGDLAALAPERIAMLQRLLPVAPIAGRPVNAMTLDRSSSPDRAPGIWVAAGAPRWWTVTLVNWDDEARDLAVALRDLGITATRLHAYDVWRDAPLADVRERLGARLEAHGTLTVALRVVATHPQVIGTSRHVVQGAVDLMEEEWDPATRTLRARSTMLDARAYAVTLAVPPGLRPLQCTANPPCAVERLPSGHVVLRWAAGGAGGDIAWAMQFRAVTRR